MILIVVSPDYPRVERFIHAHFRGLSLLRDVVWVNAQRADMAKGLSETTPYFNLGVFDMPDWFTTRFREIRLVEGEAKQ